MKTSVDWIKLKEFLASDIDFDAEYKKYVLNEGLIKETESEIEKCEFPDYDLVIIIDGKKQQYSYRRSKNERTSKVFKVLSVFREFVNGHNVEINDIHLMKYFTKEWCDSHRVETKDCFNFHDWLAYVYIDEVLHKFVKGLCNLNDGIFDYVDIKSKETFKDDIKDAVIQIYLYSHDVNDMIEFDDLNFRDINVDDMIDNKYFEIPDDIKVKTKEYYELDRKKDPWKTNKFSLIEVLRAVDKIKLAFHYVNYYIPEIPDSYMGIDYNNGEPDVSGSGLNSSAKDKVRAYFKQCEEERDEEINHFKEIYQYGDLSKELAKEKAYQAYKIKKEELKKEFGL